MFDYILILFFEMYLCKPRFIGYSICYTFLQLRSTEIFNLIWFSVRKLKFVRRAYFLFLWIFCEFFQKNSEKLRIFKKKLQKECISTARFSQPRSTGTEENCEKMRHFSRVFRWSAVVRTVPSEYEKIDISNFFSKNLKNWIFCVNSLYHKNS